MIVSHVSIVFLVELGERGVELGRLLTRAGFDARAISAIEIGNALDHILPAVIVCPHVHADSVAKALRGRPGSTEITWFVCGDCSAEWTRIMDRGPDGETSVIVRGHAFRGSPPRPN